MSLSSLIPDDPFNNDQWVSYAALLLSIAVVLGIMATEHVKDSYYQYRWRKTIKLAVTTVQGSASGYRLICKDLNTISRRVAGVTLSLNMWEGALCVIVYAAPGRGIKVATTLEKLTIKTPYTVEESWKA